MDISKFDGDIEINFIFKREDGKYENVVDDNLFKKLLNLASKRLVLNQNKYFNAEDSKKQKKGFEAGKNKKIY